MSSFKESERRRFELIKLAKATVEYLIEGFDERDIGLREQITGLELFVEDVIDMPDYEPIVEVVQAKIEELYEQRTTERTRTHNQKLQEGGEDD